MVCINTTCCTQFRYNGVMTSCWRKNSKERPDFPVIVRDMEHVLTEMRPEGTSFPSPLQHQPSVVERNSRAIHKVN